MKIKFLFSTLLCGSFLFLFICCKEEAVKTDPAEVLFSITTTAASSITATSVLTGGNISSDGGSPITSRGVCYSTSENPTVSDPKIDANGGDGNFTSVITGLLPATTYYIRAFGTNNNGTFYGNQLTLKTMNIKVADIDGNVYNTVKIGEQIWMAENLKVTKYRNGDPIPCVTDSATWVNLSHGGFCWYKNDAVSYKATYGALYNWYAASDSRNIAPVGWHLPTYDDWKTLIYFLAGEKAAAGKLKETGTAHWETPNSGANNQTDFTALPGGGRIRGQFLSAGKFGYWWSSRSDVYSAYCFYLMYNDYYAYLNPLDKKMGFSIRCVMD